MMRNASLCIVSRYAGCMTRAITVRLDEADHIALRTQAERLRVRRSHQHPAADAVALVNDARADLGAER